MVAPLVKESIDAMNEAEQKLFRELDKGLDSMEQGKIVEHEDAMKLIREKIQKYCV